MSKRVLFNELMEGLDAMAAMRGAVAVQPLTIRRRTQETCTCRAYAFPHRAKSGKCHAKQHGPFCADCGEPADPIRADFGYGALEAWGQRFTHRDVQTVSRCCEADLFEDASLTEPYHHDE